MTKPEPDQDAAEKKRRAILDQIKAFDLPPLEVGSAAFVSLEKSLLQHGCINPIVMKGTEVISGRARKVICDMHGIKYKTVQVDDLSEVDLISLQNDLNFVGRHIDTATKKEYAKHLLLASKGDLSNRAVGSMAAIDPKTVQDSREDLEASEEIPHTTIRYSRDGRSQDVSDKEERKIEADESGLEDDDWQRHEGDDEPGSDIEESENEDDEEADEEEFEEWPEDKYPQLVCIDGAFPEEVPKHVYEVNKDKASIVRRKVDRQEADLYVLASGYTLPKSYGHLTWVEAHDSLLEAVLIEQEAKADDIEDFGDERKTLLSNLKTVEAKIATAKKEKQKLDLRLKKVEDMVPPKGAEVETEEAVA